MSTEQSYSQWLTRFERVCNVCKSPEFPLDKMIGYQLFLLNFGQVNANFELAELLQLKYPLSPFILTSRHAYIRSSDTWAMELLSNLHRQGNPEPKAVWLVDSENSWSKFQQQTRPIPISESLDTIALLQLVSERMVPLWITIEKNEQQLKKATMLKQSLIKAWSEKKIQETIEENLRPLFRDVLNQKKVLLTNDMQQALNKTLGTQSCVKDIKDWLNKEIESKVQVAFYYSEKILAKKALVICDHTGQLQIFKNVLDTIDDRIELFYRQGNPKAKTVWLVDSVHFWSEFERYIQPIPISLPDTHFQAIVEAILRNGGFLTAPLWIIIEKDLQTESTQSLKVKFKQSLKEAFAENQFVEEKVLNDLEVGFYYKENGLGIEALVICEYIGELQSFKSVLDNLGYRMDPIKAIRLVLCNFPQLFHDRPDTERFFDKYLKTKVFTSLTQDESDLITKTVKPSIIATIMQNNPSTLQTYTEDSITNILSQLYELQQTFPMESSIYFKFIERCLQTIRCKVSSCDSFFLNVAIPELVDVVQSLRTPCSLTQVVRHTQRVSEVLLLFFETFQPKCLLSEIVTTEYFRDFPVQGVSLTPYAMRAFARVFQLIDKYSTSPKPLRVSVTTQSYYEWLQNLERLDPCKISVLLVQHLNDADPNSDVFFVEIHPNNVAVAKQFSHDVNGLVQQLSKKPPEQRSTLVVDITLNALNDHEVKVLISQALQLINDGRLNLILIQSLTKFSQLGLDKRSAGLLIVLNNNDDYWKGANAELKTLEKAEPVDDTTLRFFSYFYQYADDHQQYIKSINHNTRYVYKSVMEQLDQLEVLSRERFQLTLSSDPSACYIALNASGWVGIVNEDFRLTEKGMEKFLEDLLEHFIHPLCRLLNLSLTERMSIGFPLSSVNVVFDSLRITIGLESEEELNHYTDVLAFVAFVLNRIRKPELFLKDDFRKAYFLEKVNQFSAMTSNQSTYSVTYYITEGLKRIVYIKNGVMKIGKEESDQCVYYCESKIKVRVRGDENETCFNKLSISAKRMLVACFTQILNPNPDQFQADDSNQCVGISFDNSSKEVCIESLEMLSPWNAKRMYGPFPPNSAHFYLHHMNISYIEDLKHMNEKKVTIYVKQGSMCFPLLEMPLEDREFLFSEGAYTSERHHSQQIDMQYIPKGNHIQVKVERNTIEIERDLICVSIPGVTVFHRFLDDQLSYFEIDYWSIKDPLLARFMRLMTAVYVKEFKQIEFAARDNRLTHFIMKLDLETGKTFMAEATKVVYKSRYHLLHLLEASNTTPVNDTPYVFSSLSTSPNGNELVARIKNRALIMAALNLAASQSGMVAPSSAP